ncbi:NAD-dependent epimerase/dehydratase family protein [Streptomyces sp. URMC 123]|uniref:NAD-dependent epimerase/dehydratase family protein n=1 Tax=Streptomyces sp. URMC 123 TaxID=3423403 RepID=UPI003F1D4A37
MSGKPGGGRAGASPVRRVLVTGGTGFVGSAVLRALGARAGAPAGGTGETTASAAARGAEGAAGAAEAAVRVRALVRNPEAARRTAGGPHIAYRRGDLTDPASLRGLCDGVDTVLHLASRIGGDEAACAAVNVTGTRALLAEAERAGVARIVHLSTTAVYGAGPHRGVAEGDLEPAPVSATSRTRLAAEREVLAAGGTVLRAPLIYGPGDTWVVPLIAELLERVPAWVDGGRALLSLVAVDDLARLIAALALDAERPLPGGVRHAAHPRPVTFRSFLTLLTEHVGLALPTADLSLDQYGARLSRTEGRATPRQLSLIATDHWYDSEEVWRLADCPPGPGPAGRLPAYGSWYRGRGPAAR